MLDQLSKRAAQSDDFGDIFGGKIWPCCSWAHSFPADLKHADHSFAKKNRSAHNFLNGLRAERFRFYSFEYARVARFVKTVVNFCAIFTRGASSQRRRARNRDEADIFERLRNQKVQMPPFYRNTENGHLFGANAECFCDAFCDRGKRNFLLAGIARVYSRCKTLQF